VLRTHIFSLSLTTFCWKLYILHTLVSNKRPMRLSAMISVDNTHVCSCSIFYHVPLKKKDSAVLVKAIAHLAWLENTATHCHTLQHTATHCHTLQHTATHCHTLQHTATHCNTLQHTAKRSNWQRFFQRNVVKATVFHWCALAEVICKSNL